MVDTPNTDSDEASADEPVAAVDPSTDRSSDVSDTLTSTESMSVDKDEWPSEDEVERLDGEKEASNHSAKLSPKTLGIDSSSNYAYGNGSKAKRKSKHYVPPNTYVK